MDLVTRVARRVTGRNLARLKPMDLVTVYHSTWLPEVPHLINGFDATKEHSRLYGGKRHRGLFVSPNFDDARQFGGSEKIVLEMVVRAKNLHGTDYSGNIGRALRRDYPGPHAPWGEKLRQKYPDSFRPYLSETLLQRVEPQALLLGLVSPRQIKRVYYAKHGKTGKWYTRKQFLDLGLATVPAKDAPYGREQPIVDLGFDLSYPNYSFDRFMDIVEELLEVNRKEALKALQWRAEISLMPGRSDTLAEIIEGIGFEPNAAKRYADRFRERLMAKQVAARHLARRFG